MASLTGTQINNTYPSLLKTTSNTAIGGSQVNITDGEGNATPLSMSSSTLQVSAANIELVESTGGNNVINIDATKINFEGAVDFTYATVTGVGGGAAGLVSGTGTDSIKSADTLTTNTPEATQLRSLAIGDGARSRAQDCIVIGNGLVDDAVRANTVVIGSHPTRATKAAQNSTAVGSGAQAVGDRSIGIGMESACMANYATAITSTPDLTFAKNESVFIGNGSGTVLGSGSKSVQIGWETKGTSLNSVAVGTGAKALGSWSSALAYNASASGEQSTAVSYGTVASAQGTFAAADRAQATASRAIAIGGQSTSALADAAVIGPGLTALWASGTTVNQLAMVNYANLNYADNTAAAAGGVPLGGVYHTDGNLKVRHT